MKNFRIINIFCYFVHNDDKYVRIMYRNWGETIDSFQRISRLTLNDSDIYNHIFFTIKNVYCCLMLIKGRKIWNEKLENLDSTLANSLERNIEERFIEEKHILKSG